MVIKNIKNKKILPYLIIILGCIIVFILISSDKDSEKRQSEYKISEEENKKTGGEGEEEEKERTAEEEDSTATTPPETSIENENGDFEFAKHMEEVYREYPWYRKFPIEKEGYVLIWVPQEKSFRIVMLIDENSPDDKKNNLINQALSDIEEATGVSYTNYPYYVVY